MRAAEERDIPWLRLNQQSLVQLGHGKYQQRIQATVTGRTPHIAVELASDKEETNKILGSLGLPVPRQELVHDASDAVRAARKLGAVVTKPFNGNHGRGITINLTTDDEVRAGFEAAREHSRSVIVETFVGGDDHRLLVVNGELIAATKRTPGHVVGDGRSTVAELVEIVNQDPRRGVGHEKVLTRLELDAQAELMLDRAGYTAASIPTDGEVVPLRSTANLSTGGTATDVTDIIHPDNRDMAVRAVRAIGLDVGGVDFISPNIAESYKTGGGGICEVNAAPGFRMHVAPSEGTPRDAAGPVIDMLFPPGTPSRVPIAAITGTNGKTTTARMLAHIAKMAGYTPGLTTTDGVYIDGQRTVEGDMTGPVSARMVLSDPQIDMAVLETARGGLLRAGMGVPQVDVGAVLNVQSDHLGLKGIDTLEQLAEIKRIVVEVAKECAVLNADDPNVLKMSGYTDAKVICYVTMNPSHPLVREHIRAGGRACALEAGINGHMITLYDKGSHIPLMWTHLIPATLEGRALHNVQNAMVAAAMAFSLGIKLDPIRQGLRTFDTTFFQAPGRMNVYSEHPFKVLMDYGHNAHAVGVMADLAQRLDVVGRRIVVLAGPGDRRDEDLRAIAEAVAGKFDHYICRRDDSLRGRDGDEVPRIIAKALQASGVAEDAISIIPDEQQAIDAALRMGQPGDLVLVFADALTRSWKQIIKFQPEGEAFQAGRTGRGARAGADAGRGAVCGDGRRGARRAWPACSNAKPTTDARRSRVALSTDAERVMPNELPFDESRRLTGSNLYFDGTGAALETLGALRLDEAALSGWRARIALVRDALGWPHAAVVVRRHASGASLAFAAPPDQLYTAAEANEWAWLASLHALQPAAAGAGWHAPGDPAAWDADSALHTLRAMAAEEANPALVALLDAARARGVPAHADDDLLSIGEGIGSRAWPIRALPTIDDVPWAEVHGIPLAVVTGSNGKTTTVRLLAAMARAHGWNSGYSSTDGLFVGAQRVDSGDFSGPVGARTVLRHPDVDAAILETARGGLLRRGIAIHDARVAVVTNISPDHFGEYGIHDLDDLAAGQAHRRPRAGAGWAAGPQRRRSAAVATRECRHAQARAHRLVRARRRPSAPARAPRRRRHDLRRARWAPAVVDRLARPHDLGEVAAMPITLAGSAGYNIANAAAAALGRGRHGHRRRAHCRRARAIRRAAGRQPRPPAALALRRQGAARGSVQACQVFLDYAHNPDGLRGLLQVAGTTRAAGRLGLILGQAGNRKDSDIRALAAVAAEFRPDRVWLKDIGGEYMRGRAPARSPRSCATSCCSQGLPDSALVVCLEETRAARDALRGRSRATCSCCRSTNPLRAMTSSRCWTACRPADWRAGMALPDA